MTGMDTIRMHCTRNIAASNTAQADQVPDEHELEKEEKIEVSKKRKRKRNKEMKMKKKKANKL